VIGLLYRAAGALRRRSLAGDHGRIGEDLAHRYLRRRGCTIVARNYRTPSGSGEIDLVAWHGETLAFVEVKTRSTDEYGEPGRAVDLEKQERLQRAARDYARRANVDWNRARFDIVSVVLDKPVRIDWFRDAFGHG
jgi:putative endonuclease